MKSDQKGLWDYADFYNVLQRGKKVKGMGIELFSLIFWLQLFFTSVIISVYCYMYYILLLLAYTYYIVFHFIVKFCNFPPCNIGKEECFLNIIKQVDQNLASQNVSSECMRSLWVTVRMCSVMTLGFWLLPPVRSGWKVLQDSLQVRIPLDTYSGTW